MRQFLIDLPPGEYASPGDDVVLSSEESRHLQTVLRTEPGSLLRLTDGRGFRYTGRLLPVQKSTLVVEILTRCEDPTESQRPLLVLAVAVVKSKRFEWALEKACELGVHVILPLQTEYGNVKPGAGKQQRWRTILTSAVKQCGRSLIPELREITTLAAVLDSAQGPVWFGASPGEERDRSEDPAAFTAVLEIGQKVPREIMVCLGPEGGWSPAELALLVKGGASPIHLGPHILRTETAAAAAMVVLQQRRDEFHQSCGSLDR